MDTLGYTQFSSGLHQRIVTNRLPVNGTIEVTRRCPLTCVHCYNRLPMGDREARRGELTYEEHCRILDEITEAGCLWLLYTGGEIFARDDFLDIYTHAKRKGLIVSLFANGTLITPSVADYLVEWRPFSIEITLYGRTQETYERFTGIPGSYARCMRGISLILERGLPLKLKTMAVTLNKHEIWEMKRFAEEELGVEFSFDPMINPRIDCSHSPLAVRLSPAEIVEMDLRDPKRAASWKNLTEYFAGWVSSSGCRGNLYDCGGGITSFAVDPQGKLSLCVLSQMDKVDLRTESFRGAWGRLHAAVRCRKRVRQTKCMTCPLIVMCDMCPANGELENRDPELPVDFLCQTAHLRAYALGLPMAPHGQCEYCDGGSASHELTAIAASLRNRCGEADALLPDHVQ
jgi:radical SAM protein with 4Fe4S-binding SPASM domain